MKGVNTKGKLIGYLFVKKPPGGRGRGERRRQNDDDFDDNNRRKQQTDVIRRHVPITIDFALRSRRRETNEYERCQIQQQ